MKKPRLLSALLIMLLVLCVFTCALAAEIRPLDQDFDNVDLNNGVFCLTVKDADRIADGGWFTASLYLEDHYDAAQIEALAAGDTVMVNGQAWTVHEVVTHEDEETGRVESYEIYTQEENEGYIVFTLGADGCYLCITDDWSPVSPLGDVRVILPLPDKFVYYYGEEDTPRDMEAFLDQLEVSGGNFVAYNTICVFEDGRLVEIDHSDYPAGPQAEETEEAEDAAV